MTIQLDASLKARGILANKLGLPQQKVGLVADGDSKGNEPPDALNWACVRQGLIAPTVTSIIVGGARSNAATSPAVGLTHPTRLALIASTVAGLLATCAAVDVSLKIGTNDFADGTAPATVLANIRKYWEGYARPAGARYLILNSVDPRADTTAPNPSIIAFNRLAQAYAAANATHVVFIDSHSYLVDLASSTGAALGGTSNAYLAVMYDGLHESLNGPLAASPAFADIAAALYAKRPTLNLSKADLYNSATAPFGNMIGMDSGGNATSIGRFTALGGTDGLTLANTATKFGTPPLGWTASGALSGDLSVVFTAETPTLFGRAVPAVRLALSGTPTSDLQLLLRLTSYPVGDGSTPYDVQADFAWIANALTGVQGVGLICANGFPSAAVGGFNLAYPSDGLSKLDGFHRCVSAPAPTPITFQFGAAIYVYAKAGTPLSGSIDLIKASVARTGPIPAPTP